MSELKEFLKDSKQIVFFGGAGVSTASNIPDFRGKNGIYNTDNRWGIPPESIISHSFFVNHTKDFYEYYCENMVFPEAQPNYVHKALAQMEAEGKLKAVVTQNIDGLHQKAGSKTVYELHGSIHRNYCMKCHKSYPLEKVLEADGIPYCECGGIIKPDVVLYEEPLNNEIWTNAELAIQKADTLIVGGSTLTVMPASFLVQMFNGKLVIINSTLTPFDRKADLVIHDDLTKVFKELL